MIPEVVPMNWDYVAGFFDGEGSMVLTTDRGGERKSINVQISIGQSNKEVLLLILDFLKEQGICGGVYTKTEKRMSALSRKTMYTLIVGNRRNVVLMLTQLVPRIHVKRHWAEDILRFLKVYPAMERGKNPENRQLIKYTRGQQKFQAHASL
jgi:intein/homing endonuclease